MDQSDISKYERGELEPPEEALRRMAEAAHVDWPVVVHLHRFYAAVLSAAERRRPVQWAEPLTPEIIEPALLAVTPYLIEEGARAEPWRQPPEEARREAEEIWSALERFPIPRRRRFIGMTSRASRSWALAARVCEASRRAAADDAEVALELAELALSIAERVPGASLRSRAAGYCWAYVGNARRVKTDFDSADEAFARAWELWRAGAEADSELLPEWRLLSLEASLRREQRRYSDSLDLLARAWAAGEDEPEAAAIILLKKQHVFEVMGDIEAAMVALAEAAPHIEAAGDPDLLFRLRFKRTNHLCHLKRYDEAAALLPRVRELAIEQANALDLIRVVWLEARLAGGQGREEEAVAGLQQVRREFRQHELPYEEALASLDLAVLWLRTGRVAEVRELAVEMETVFRVKKIHREALAALTLFRKAARKEEVTVELARRLGDYLYRAQHRPELRFNAGD